MAKKTKVIQYGLGAMGSQMVQMMLDKRDLEVVGAISGSGRLAGKDLGKAIGLSFASSLLQKYVPVQRREGPVEVVIVLNETAVEVGEKFCRNLPGRFRGNDDVVQPVVESHGKNPRP